MAVVSALLSCEIVDTNPVLVSDLRISSASGTSATLEWTQVPDGKGAPADYMLGFGRPTVTRDSVVANPTVVEGTAVGATIAHTVENLTVGEVYEFAVLSFRYLDDGSQIATGPSKAVSTAVQGDSPGAIDDFEVTSVTPTSITVRWTQVSDGAGGVANYGLVVGSPTVTWETAVATAVEVTGTQVGVLQTHTFTGLTPSTTYEFQAAAMRGTFATNPVFGPVSTKVSAATLPPPPIPAGAFFSENFDTGAKVNADGFTWSTSGSRVTVATERPFSGTHSLRFRFGPDTAQQDSNAEQRFNLGRNLGEVWIEYMLFVPENFRHRSQATSVNNKFFMIWNTTYGSGSGTWQAGYEYDRSSDTTSTIRPMSSKESGTNATFVTSSALGHPDHGKAFAGPQHPLKPGTWVRIRLQFARSSAAGATDGIMRMWIDNDLFSEMTNGPFRNLDNIGETVLRNGYFMGWSNSGFTEITDWYVDDVRFYEFNPGWIP